MDCNHPTPEISPCDSNPCKNDGMCSEKGAGYKCNCAEGFTGVNCAEGRPAGKQ